MPLIVAITQCHYNYKRRSIHKIPQVISNTRKTITTLNVAQFSHRSIVILQRNPWAHWHICPSCDEVKISFCATNWGVRKQLFTNSHLYFLTTVESVTSQVFLSETQTNKSYGAKSRLWGGESNSLQLNNCQQFVSDVLCVRLKYHGRGSYLATEHMSGPVKQHLEGPPASTHNNEEVQTAIREWIRMKELNFPRTMKKFLNSCQNGTNASTSSRIMLYKGGPKNSRNCYKKFI